MSLLSLWFRWSVPLRPSSYLTSGVVLGAVKYVVDFLLVRNYTGRAWTPDRYFRPFFSLGEATGPAPDELLLWMALWAVPFIALGFSLTIRRAANAGNSSSTRSRRDKSIEMAPV